MDALKKTINDLKAAVQSAKDKQKAAKDECAKLERDMAEFKNNKEGKIDELKVSQSHLRSLVINLSSIFNIALLRVGGVSWCMRFENVLVATWQFY